MIASATKQDTLAEQGFPRADSAAAKPMSVPPVRGAARPHRQRTVSELWAFSGSHVLPARPDQLRGPYAHRRTGTRPATPATFDAKPIPLSPGWSHHGRNTP